jgi:hypothetical protein
MRYSKVKCVSRVAGGTKKRQVESASASRVVSAMLQTAAMWVGEVAGEYVLGLVIPRKTKLEPDLSALRNFIN